jgi:ATP synthase protein I
MTQQSAQTGSYPFSATLRGALVPTLVAGGLAAVVLGLVRGLAGGVSGLVGVAIAVVFFASGLLLMDKLVRDRDPMLFMAVGMAIYFAQVLLLLGVLVVAGKVESLDSWAAGVAMLVAVLAWQVGQVRAWRRARVPVYDPPVEAPSGPVAEGSDEPPRAGSGESS